MGCYLLQPRGDHSPRLPTPTPGESGAGIDQVTTAHLLSGLTVCSTPGSSASLLSSLCPVPLFISLLLFHFFSHLGSFAEHLKSEKGNLPAFSLFPFGEQAGGAALRCRPGPV